MDEPEQSELNSELKGQQVTETMPSRAGLSVSQQENSLRIKGQLANLELEEMAMAEEAAPLQTIFSWEAPDRVYSEKSRGWFTGVSLIFMLCIAAAALLQETLLVFAIVTLMVVVYLSNVIKPLLVKHEITNKGIFTGNQLYIWQDIQGFWVGKRGDHYLLMVDLNEAKKPNRLIMLLGTTDPKLPIRKLFPHIPYLTKNQVSEDFINTFTIGTYLPISDWMNQERS